MKTITEAQARYNAELATFNTLLEAIKAERPQVKSTEVEEIAVVETVTPAQNDTVKRATVRQNDLHLVVYNATRYNPVTKEQLKNFIKISNVAYCAGAVLDLNIVLAQNVASKFLTTYMQDGELYYARVDMLQDLIKAKEVKATKTTKAVKAVKPIVTIEQVVNDFDTQAPLSDVAVYLENLNKIRRPKAVTHKTFKNIKAKIAAQHIETLAGYTFEIVTKNEWHHNVMLNGVVITALTHYSQAVEVIEAVKVQ